MPLLLGSDFGTTYFKVGLSDERGALRSLGRVAVEKRIARPGWCELPVETFWDLLRHGLREALAAAAASQSDIGALSYSSQANTFVLLDSADRPLTPLVIWTDTRGGAAPAEWMAFSEREAFRHTVGFGPLTPESAVCKWRWFQRQEPGLWLRVARVMTISDYFTFAITGEPAGDAGTAALLGLFDLRRNEWWPEALAAFGVDREKLSRPLPPGARCGTVSRTGASLLGLATNIPYAVGGLDHQVAAVGSGLGRFADLSISTGTVLAAVALVDKVNGIRGCFHGPHIDGRRFYRLAFDPVGAGQLEDYRREFARDQTIEQLVALAADPTSPGRAVREIMQRVALAQRKLVSRVAGGEKIRAIAATGGGARSSLWLQIKADILGVPVIVPRCAERACLGAAVFAAAAAGVYRDADEAIAAMIRPDRVFEPAGGANDPAYSVKP